ncbi:inosine guanosine and xanthosine phosphorylase family protein [Fistulina hepatica ATCC 64428]|uniref:Purine nucleoside phosphorylase n=1 Tax=Fistulina hepatica ATCC 64428 TaxID=1128425 RepID=A0A0D7AH96_9AGAR|nr:inosine guanosine and xanthosine phosphorylase family protein [Fistulina hepatica ATCC 64428]
MSHNPINVDAALTETIQVIRSKLPSDYHKPAVAIVCGSGLGGLADNLRGKKKIFYNEIPGFSSSTVAGHAGALVFGMLGKTDTPVVVMLGRLHAYEGHTLAQVVYPIRTLARIGVKNFILTNAAGSLNPKLSAGTIVVLHDHIALPNLTGMNPLLGPVISDLPRFLPLSDAYSPALRRLVFIAAHDLQLPDDTLAEGTYAWVSGPIYETPAEGRFLRAAGADVVGMSTVPELLAARHEGVPHVMAMSLVTNPVIIPETYRSIKDEVAQEIMGKMVELPEMAVVSHDDVLKMGKEKEEVMQQLVERIVELI